MIKTIFFLMLACLFTSALAETHEGVPLITAPIDLHDTASLQRGAKMFMNYCFPCHSIRFLRYNRMAQDVGILNAQGQLDVQLLKDNLIFTGALVTDPIQNALPPSEAKVWFGLMPPDLSLIVRSRGKDWLYTYLLSFYQDPTRPFGVNNWLFNETTMPDVLVNLRGTVLPLYHEETISLGGSAKTTRAVVHLVWKNDGMMTAQQFQSVVLDLVNFLTYVSEPNQIARKQLGFWVLGFLIIFAGLCFLLKKEYWKTQ